MLRYAEFEAGDGQHRSGAFPTDRLQGVERLLPARVGTSAETGCGKSTVLLSNLSDHHTAFCVDDRDSPGSSVLFYETCPLTRVERVHPVFGPTQISLAQYQHPHLYDIVLLDGPHGWPFPELEYFHFYPHIRKGGILIVDDVNIPTIGRMADFIAEDAMWELIKLVDTTALFRRTDAPTFDPTGDGWWAQRFNQRRVYEGDPVHADDGGQREVVTKYMSRRINRRRWRYQLLRR